MFRFVTGHLLFISAFLLSYGLGAQVTTRIGVQSGGTVTFNINSMNRYENGLVRGGWTTLEMFVVDSADLAGATWNLSVSMSDNTFVGDFGNDLDPAFLELSIVSTGSADLSGYFTGDFLHGVYKAVEGTTDMDILLNFPKGDFSEYKLQISYRVVSDTGVELLLGKPPDYYFSDLIFELTKN